MYAASPLFRAAFAYASNTYDTVAILSAKYGLLLPDDEIEPYEVTLNALNVQAQKQWAQRVLWQMQERLNFHGIRQVFFHAGKAYREHLGALLAGHNIDCMTPLAKRARARRQLMRLRSQMTI